ncbi:MAG TPA: sugar ABC transporter substrate-binding protein [Firmicutes bacterium]|nr:sugar ABC transporter substrate-binding protein [Bacillota bacterium]
MKRVVVFMLALLLTFGLGNMAAAKTEIEWHVWGTAAYLADWEKYIDMFEASQDQITVKLVNVTGSQSEHLMILLAAGKAPDLAMVNWVGYRPNWFMGLNDFIERDQSFRVSDHFPNAIDGFTYQGEIWALPFHFGGIITYYNATMFNETGVNAPDPNWTLADFEQISRKLNKDTNGDNKIDIYGYAMGNLHREHWFYRHGVQLFSDDGTEAIPDVNKAAELFAYLQNLANSGIIAPTLSGSREEFYAGNKVAMIDEGPWALSDIKNNAKFDWGVVPIPQGNVRATLLFLDGNAIPAGAPHPEAAWEFLKFLSSEELAPLWIQTKGAPSTVKRAAGTYLKMYGDIPGINAVLDAVQYGYPLPKAINYDLVRYPVLVPVLRQVLANTISPIQAATDLKVKFNEQLAGWREQFK